MNLVSHGAKLECSMGDTPSTFAVLPANKTNAGNAPAATVQDFQPMVNVMPFGQCKSVLNPAVQAATAAKAGVFTPAPCIPDIRSPWAPPNPAFTINSLPMLNDACSCLCKWMGQIKVAQAGATVVSLSMGAGGGQSGGLSAPSPTHWAPLDAHGDEELVTLHILLCDELQQPLPGAPYRLHAGGAQRDGSADGHGLLVEHDVSLKQACLLEWGAATGGAHPFRFCQTLRNEG